MKLRWTQTDGLLGIIGDFGGLWVSNPKPQTDAHCFRIRCILGDIRRWAGDTSTSSCLVRPPPTNPESINRTDGLVGIIGVDRQIPNDLQ